MSGMLLNENPLLVIPELARRVGLNESIIIQQIHYWNEINKKAKNNLRDGYHWTYNSFDDWQKQFPFWSVITIKRAFSKLEGYDLIITGNYNKLPIDRTKWYRINYLALENLEKFPLYQYDTTIVSKWYDQWINMIRPLPEITSEINTENNYKNYIVLDIEEDMYLKVYNQHYRNMYGKDHMPVSEKNMLFIEDRISSIRGNSDFEDWEEKVEEHFNNLPKKNNGSIVPFLHASYRHFEVGEYH